MSDNTCPICYEEYSSFVIKQGNLNFPEIKSNCRHFFCQDCLIEMRKNKINKCPLCRENIERLIIKVLPFEERNTLVRERDLDRELEIMRERELIDRRENLMQREREQVERQRELDRQMQQIQRQIEQQRQIQRLIERQREIISERERQRELERQREQMEREQMEREQRRIERQREIILERQRKWERQMELERQRTVSHRFAPPIGQGTEVREENVYYPNENEVRCPCGGKYSYSGHHHTKRHQKYLQENIKRQQNNN